MKVQFGGKQRPKPAATWRLSYVVESAGHTWGPFKTADEAARWVDENHIWGAAIVTVRLPRKGVHE